MLYNGKTVSYDNAPFELGVGIHYVEFYVTYNGGNRPFIVTSIIEKYGLPTLLMKDRVYKVTKMEVDDWSTDITLEGVKGQFNSVWFDEVLV